MRILSIESPQQLKDGTVKASITVSEENYVPLILLKIRACKGDAIIIDDAGEVRTKDMAEDSRLDIVITAIRSILQMHLDDAFQDGVDSIIGKEEIKKEGV